VVIEHFSCDKTATLTQKLMCHGPSYLNNLISVQPARSTNSASVVTLSRPPTISSLKITDRSFRYASPRLWNQLPDSLRRASPVMSRLTSSVTCQLISVIITTLITHHFFTLSLKAQNLPFRQVLPTLI